MTLQPTIRQHLREARSGEPIAVFGWVKTVRRQKSLTFLQIADGSNHEGLQAIAKGGDAALQNQLEQVQTGCSVRLEGSLRPSPACGQNWELAIARLEILGSCDAAAYPLQKKHHTLEFLRTIGHLRPRAQLLGAIARVRSEIFTAVHRFFSEREFLFVSTPIITTSDCEGGGDLFRVIAPGADGAEFFGKPAYLTVSGQLNAEIYASSHARAYAFGPTFRAENSHTARHLAEFWMIEPEVAFADLAAVCQLAEDFIRQILTTALERCSGDLAVCERQAPGLTDRLQAWSQQPFRRLTYTEAIDVLQASRQTFEYSPEWGGDLQSEHERYLAEHYAGGPVVVTDYPRTLKPFYARTNGDGRTVGAMDVLLPQIGEIIGGSQREERYDVLQERLSECRLPPENYWWYLELRQFGSVPHSGFGAGFERLVRLITGVENVRDIAPFPRVPGQAGF